MEEIEQLKLQILKKNEIIDSQRVNLKRYEFCIQEAIIFLGKPVLDYSDWRHGTERSKTPQGLADKQIQIQNAVHIVNALENIEIKALECIKLALNYLVNVRNSEALPSDALHSEALHSDALHSDALHSEALGSNRIPKDKISNRIPKDKVPEKVKRIIDLDDIDGDISNSRRAEKIVEKPGCSTCTQRMLQMDKVNEEMQERLQEIINLKKDLWESEKEKERVTIAKQVLEQELEDLTEQLFEQANNMVIEEAKGKLELETKNISLKAELSGALKRAQGREDEITDLKKIISALKTAKIKASKSYLSLVTSPSMSFIPQISMEFPKGIFSFEKLPLTTNTLYIDGILYAEVQDHLCSDLNTSTQFMKRVLSEDVEYALFYCYAFSGSLKSFGSGGVGFSLKKRFLDSVVKCFCEVGQGSTEEEKGKCGLCTVERIVSFKVTFGQKAEEIQVCRFCRDRILACMDFFTYNNFLRINKPSFSILNIFRCFMWLRNRINAGRVGSCSLFDTDYPSLIADYALPADWETNCHILN